MKSLCILYRQLEVTLYLGKVKWQTKYMCTYASTVAHTYSKCESLRAERSCGTEKLLHTTYKKEMENSL